MKRGAALIAGLVALAGLGWWFGLRDVGATLRHASPAGLARYAVLTTLVWVACALRWWLVANSIGGAAAPGRMFGARLAGDAVSALVPSGKMAGEPLRVALLRAAGTPGEPAAAGVAADRLLELIGNMLAVIVYVLIFTLTRAPVRAPLALAVIMLALLGVVGVTLRDLARGRRPLRWLYSERMRRAVSPRRHHWLDALQRVEAHVERMLQSHPRRLVVGLLMTLLIESLIVLQYHALLDAFGVQLDLPSLLLVLLGGGLASALPTPAGLGALEATQVLLVGASTGRPQLGFIVGLLVRLHQTVLLVAGLAALAWLGGSLRAARKANAPAID